MLFIVVLFAFFLLFECDPGPVSNYFTLEMEGEGFVAPALGAHSYVAGSVVNIAASPAIGWEFSGWVGDVADLWFEETNIVMDSDKMIYAFLGEVADPSQVILTVEREGSVEPPLGAHTFDHGSALLSVFFLPAIGMVE